MSNILDFIKQRRLVRCQRCGTGENVAYVFKGGQKGSAKIARLCTSCLRADLRR
jgi:hypothetical protein